MNTKLLRLLPLALLLAFGSCLDNSTDPSPSTDPVPSDTTGAVVSSWLSQSDTVGWERDSVELQLRVVTTSEIKKVLVGSAELRKKDSTTWSGKLSLSEGSNTFVATVHVDGEEPSHSDTLRITRARAKTITSLEGLGASFALDTVGGTLVLDLPTGMDSAIFAPKLPANSFATISVSSDGNASVVMGKPDSARPASWMVTLGKTDTARITIKVTAQDTTSSRTYVVVVVRAPKRETRIVLVSPSVDTTVPYGTSILAFKVRVTGSDIRSVRIGDSVAKAGEDSTYVAILPLLVGVDTIEVVAKSAEGAETKSRWRVVRVADSSVNVSVVWPKQAISRAWFEDTATIRVEVKTLRPVLGVMVGDVALARVSDSSSIYAGVVKLKQGVNEFTASVRCSDSTRPVGIPAITREVPSPNDSLRELLPSTGNFDSSRTILVLPEDVDTVTIKPVASHANAKVVATVGSGVERKGWWFTLSRDTVDVIFLVTAEDTNHVRQYSVRIVRTHKVLPVAATPVMSPAGGVFTEPDTVVIAVPDSSTIYFTTDGSTPTTSSTRYTSPLAISSTTTLKAFATGPGMISSPVVSAVYMVTGTVAKPTFSPAPGAYFSMQSIAIGTATSGASIYYTTDGTTPTTSSPLYAGPFAIGASKTIKAIAVKKDWLDSPVDSAVYTIDYPEAGTPTFSVLPGTYATSQSVELSSATSGAIYYTTDGTTPTTSSTRYTTPISVTSSTTIKAIAVASGFDNSPVASAAYTITGTVATPALDPAPGEFTSMQSVTISTATPGAAIYYTTDGTIPTSSSSLYAAPFNIGVNTMVKAIAVKAGWVNSAVVSGTYSIKAAAPIFSKEGGTYSSDLRVELSSATPGATIYYTIDGTTPTTSSTRYTSAIAPPQGASTIKAIAVAPGFANSAVATAVYTVRGTVTTPLLDPMQGTYTSMQTVAISAATPGAVIYYTTDGTMPTTASTRYTSPISVTSSTTIKAIAVAPGHDNSAVATAVYTITGTVATPVLDPLPGAYTSMQSVTITTTTPGAQIHYTTDGTTPTTASALYAAPFNIGATTMVKAIAVKGGWTNSAVASGTYFINYPNAATPTFSVVPGTYVSGQSVTLSSTTVDAVIYFTTDGTVPTTSSALYTSAIDVPTGATTTIKAIAVAPGHDNSAVASAEYVITGTAATPVFNPLPGAFTSMQSVTITTTTPGAQIRYTTDGTTPTASSPLYVGAFDVAVTTMVKAIAVKTGWTNSAVASGTYFINYPDAATPTFSVVPGTYTSGQTVALSSNTVDAVIYYTTDGTIPTRFSTRYTSPISVTSSTTIKAVATASGYDNSAVASAVYTISSP